MEKSEARAGILIVILLVFLICFTWYIKDEKYNEMESFYKSELANRGSLINTLQTRINEDTAYYQVFERMFNEVKNK